MKGEEAMNGMQKLNTKNRTGKKQDRMTKAGHSTRYVSLSEELGRRGRGVAGGRGEGGGKRATG